MSRSLIGQVDELQEKTDIWRHKDNDETRRALRNAAADVVNSLQAPITTFDQLSFQPILPMAVMTALEGGWLQQLAATEDCLSAEQLATLTGSSKPFIIRFMRVLTVSAIVVECDVELYKANDTTRFLTGTTAQDYFKHLHVTHVKAYLHIPQWAKEIGFRNPNSHLESNFMSRFKQPFWKTLDENPQADATFTKWMDLIFNSTFTLTSASHISHIIQVDDSCESDTVHLVDIGGASGSLAKAFRTTSNSSQGRVISQDRESVALAAHDAEARTVEHMQYNFFDPQPVKGARAYSLRHILHDWPDADCAKILENTARSMKKDHSTLFIFEMIVPSKGCDANAAFVDILVLAELGGQERTLEQWESLLSGVGLKIENSTLLDKRMDEWVIEAKLA